MKRNGVFVTTAFLTACAPCLCLGQPQFPVAGDIVVGLSNGNPLETIRLYSAAGVQKPDAWDAFNFAQSIEWDNSGGILHNPNGRLLAANFGLTTAGNQGGSIYIYQSGAANGWNGVLAFGCIGTPPNLTCAPLTFNSPGLNGVFARLGGLSISPDNMRIAVTSGSDTGQIYVFDYSAATSTLSNPRQTDALPTPLTGGTSSSVWISNTIVFGVDPGGNMVTVDTSQPTLTPVGVGVLPGAPTGGSRLSAATYVEQIADYIYISISDFQAAPANLTTNRLYAVDPTTFAVVAGPIDFSTSHPTSREIALGANGDLYFSTFDGNGVFPNPEGGVFRVPNVTNPLAIQPNSSVPVAMFGAVGTGNSSFNGMDVASAVSTVQCYPDCNNSTTLTIADFGCFQAAFAAGNMYADCNSSGTLTIADFGCFQAAFAAGCP